MITIARGKLTYSFQSLDICTCCQVKFANPKKHYSNDDNWNDVNWIYSTNHYQCTDCPEGQLSSVKYCFWQQLVHSPQILWESIEYPSTCICVEKPHWRTYESAKRQVVQLLIAQHTEIVKSYWPCYSNEENWQDYGSVDVNVRLPFMIILSRRCYIRIDPAIFK